MLRELLVIILILLLLGLLPWWPHTRPWPAQYRYGSPTLIIVIILLILLL